MTLIFGLVVFLLLMLMWIMGNCKKKIRYTRRKYVRQPDIHSRSIYFDERPKSLNDLETNLLLSGKSTQYQNLIGARWNPVGSQIGM